MLCIISEPSYILYVLSPLFIWINLFRSQFKIHFPGYHFYFLFPYLLFDLIIFIQLLFFVESNNKL